MRTRVSKPGAKRVGLMHGAGNAFMLLLYAMSWAQRGANGYRPRGGVDGWQSIGVA